MADLSNRDRRALLKLARSTIRAKLFQEADTEIADEQPGAALEDMRGCFVSLHRQGVLRGCIGCIEPVKPLAQGVQENAIQAAFRDPRFPPLSADELSEIQIEVSVLTPPRVLEFTGEEDLKRKLIPGKHGVILARGWHRSTFLPQVWKQLPDTEQFLENLCLKAGMESLCWKDQNTVIKVYEAEYFSEEGGEEF